MTNRVDSTTLDSTTLDISALDISTSLDITTGTAAADVVATLRTAVRGRVLTGSEAGYATEIAGFDLALVHSPAVVVAALDAQDVIATVKTAAAAALSITVVGGGHGDIPPITDGIMLTTRHLDAVALDRVARTATVGVGATWHDVLDVVTPHGLAPVCGSAPAVGVGGFLLGGGLGPIGRTYGFGSDHVRSFEIVTADGVLRSVSADRNADLFWALRGGKGGFGVVTTVTIELLQLTSIYGGGEYYADTDIAGLLHGYQRLVATGVPDALTASVAILRLPDLPGLPEPLRGRTVGHLRIGYVGGGADDPAEVEALLAPVRAATGSPIFGGLHVLPCGDVGTIHGDPTVPSAHATAGTLLDRLDPETIDSVLRVAGPDVRTPLAIVEIRQYGGALAGSAPSDAVSGRSAGFGMWVSGAPMPEDFEADAMLSARRAVRGVLEAVAPWSTERVQINFCGSVNTADEAAAAWTGDVAERLAAIRRRYDPAGLFPYIAGSIRG